MTRISDTASQGDHASAHRALARAAAGRPVAWWLAMGFEQGPPRSLDNVERRFRQLAAAAHPDRGGTPEQMQALLAARAAARRALSAAAMR